MTGPDPLAPGPGPGIEPTPPYEEEVEPVWWALGVTCMVFGALGAAVGALVLSRRSSASIVQLWLPALIGVALGAVIVLGARVVNSRSRRRRRDAHR